MAFPLIPFVAGAVVGGLASYFYRDEKVRADIKRTTENVSGKVKEGVETVTEKVSSSVTNLRGKLERRPAAPAKPVKATASKATTSRKRPARKPAAAKPAATPEVTKDD